jgi:hypothetical protein
LLCGCHTVVLPQWPVATACLAALHAQGNPRHLQLSSGFLNSMARTLCHMPLTCMCMHKRVVHSARRPAPACQAVPAVNLHSDDVSFLLDELLHMPCATAWHLACPQHGVHMHTLHTSSMHTIRAPAVLGCCHRKQSRHTLQDMTGPQAKTRMPPCKCHVRPLARASAPGPLRQGPRSIW